MTGCSDGICGSRDANNPVFWCHKCLIESAKRRHDELASERAAGARDERAMIVDKVRSHASELGGHEGAHAKDIASWIEKGCP